MLAGLRLFWAQIMLLGLQKVLPLAYIYVTDRQLLI